MLSLPAYGRYLHTYEAMRAARDELVASAGDRVSVLHLGRDLDEEAVEADSVSGSYTAQLS